MLDEIDDAKRVEGSNNWSTFYDPISGWICIGSHSSKESAAIEFASNTIAVVCNQMIVALWLKPEFIQ